MPSTILRTIPCSTRVLLGQLSGVAELRDKPSGTIRISCTDYVANTIL